jgi:hypothetical protein
MVYTFCSPLGIEETCNVIKNAVASMKGKIREVRPGFLQASWRTQPYHSMKFHTVLPTKFQFYVGEGIVRVVTGTSNMQMFPMTFKPGNVHITWNAFIESLLAVAPGLDFGIEPGAVKMVAAQFVGDGLEEVFVSTTRHSPSLGGAVLGGLLFGTAGAIIGGSAGTSHTTGKSSMRFSDKVLTKARYSNGLLAEGVLFKNSSTYQEILVNMSRLSEPVEN